MNFRIVFHMLGTLVIAVGAAMMAPIGWAFYFGSADLTAFLTAAPLVILLGLAMRLAARNPHRTSEEALHQKEALTVVGLGWVVVSVMAALPMYWSGGFATFVDAYFEATSGLTTTGASILTDIEAQPPGVLFWRSFLHWLGGMGIIVLTIAILPRLELGGTQLFRAEAPGPGLERIKPRLRETSKRLWQIYIGLSLAETLLLRWRGLSLYDALIQTFGTVATAGFSNYNASIGAFQDPVVEGIVMIFMVLAGTNFALHYRAVAGREGIRAYRDEEFLTYLAVLAGLSLLLSLLLARSGMAFAQALRLGSFQATSVITTTGFTTADFNRWPETARLLLTVAMFIGGSTGSTTGAIKIVRWIILFRYVSREMVQLLHPRAVLPLRLGGRTLSEEAVRGVIGFVLLYFLLFVATAIILSASGLDLVTAVSAAAATLGNIGPGLAAISPASDYAFLAPGMKLFLSFLMIAGRLEIYAVLLLLTPAFWRRG